MAAEEEEFARSRATGTAADDADESPPVRPMQQPLNAPPTPLATKSWASTPESPRSITARCSGPNSDSSNSRTGSAASKRFGLPSPPSRSRVDLIGSPGPLAYDRHDVKGFYSTNRSERFDQQNAGPPPLPSSMFSSGTPRFKQVVEPAHTMRDRRV